MELEDKRGSRHLSFHLHTPLPTPQTKELNNPAPEWNFLERCNPGILV